MSAIRDEQIEALAVLVDFNDRLLKNLPIIVKELSGERLDDTDIFLKDILNAINWEIQVVNGTMDLIKEKDSSFDKKQFNEKILMLDKAVVAKSDEKMSEAFRELIVEFEKLGKIAREVIA